MLVPLVSVSSFEPCLIDSVGHILLVFFIPSDFHNLFFPSSAGFPKLQEKGHGEDLQFGASISLMFGCGSLHLSPSAVSGTLSDDDWTSGGLSLSEPFVPCTSRYKDRLPIDPRVPTAVM